MFIRGILILSFLVLGCAKEDVPPSPPVQVNLKGQGDCLSNFSEIMGQLHRGELSNPQVSDFWTCVEKAVYDYQRLTAGDENGNYSPQAVRHFFQRYFLKDRTIDDSFLASIMEVKRVFLSGSTQLITVGELSRLQDLLKLVKQLNLDLNAHAKVIFMHAPQASDEEVARAGEALDKAVLHFGQWLDQNNQAYSFVQLAELLGNLKKFTSQGGQPSELFADLEKALEVLPAVKQILLAGRQDMIRGDEWLRLIAVASSSYRAMLGAQYSFREGLNLGLLRGAFPQGLGHVVSVLEQSLQAHRKQEISFSEWRELFAQIEKSQWLPEAFTADSMMQAFTWLVHRVLNDGQGKSPTSLKAQHVASLRRFFTDWVDLQRGEGTRVASFKTLLASSLPMQWDAQGRLEYANPDLGPSWSDFNQRFMVWPFLVMDKLKTAYGGIQATELDGDQMTLAATEILGVLQGFGWMKSTEVTIGKRLLRESDLFTLASNGNGVVDVNEATRYLAAIASSYRAARIWLDEAEVVCGGREAQCVRRVGGDLNRDILNSMPRLKEWLRSGDTLRRFAHYSQASEETILDEVIQGDFEIGDLLQVWMIFQYVETFLRRFDVDSSEAVSLAESSPAFDLFGPTLANLLSGFGLPEDELFGFFTFMMKYGDTPFTMYGGQILYNHWKWHRNDWAFQSQRTELMGILNQLSKL